MSKKIVFVSEINAMSPDTTSTHILTENIIYGFKKAGFNVTFIAICGSDEAYKNTEIYYKDKVDGLYTVRSRFGRSDNKYKKLLYMLNGVIFPQKYRNAVPNGVNTDGAVIVSHTPSYEAIFICRELLRRNRALKYIQYWSDPIALSGIMPEQFGFKRKPFYLLEKYAFGLADEIVFGTETLLKMNAALYQKFKFKMRFVDIAYLHGENSAISRKNNMFIYAGNYYGAIRNIKPLYEAFAESGNEFFLDIYGGGDTELEERDNIKINGRVSPEKLAETEKTYRNTIVLLNHSCLQIPGKTFYRTNTDQIILVIADGAHKDELKKYLSKYNRFVICDNEKEDIKNALRRIANTEAYACPKEIIETLSPEYVSAEIIGGRDSIENRAD